MNRLYMTLPWLCLGLLGKISLPGACAANTAFLPTPLVDTIPPAINCPESDTIKLDPGLCSIAYTYDVVAYDDQPDYVITQTAGLASGDTFPLGTTVNQFLVTDLSGNTDACSFKVIVEDHAGPLFCKDAIQVSLLQGCALKPNASQLLEDGIYGCPTDFVVEYDPTPPGADGPWVPAVFGPTDLNKTYGFRVTDISTGNRCWGSLTLIDKFPPEISVQDINVPCAIGTVYLSPDYLKDSLGIDAAMPTAVEGCGGAVTISFSDVQESLDCDTLYNISAKIYRTWTATDERGNSTSALQTIYRLRALSDINVPRDITLDFCDNPDVSDFNITGQPFIKFGGQVFPLKAPCEVYFVYNDSIDLLCERGYRVVRQWEFFDYCRPSSPVNLAKGIQVIDVIDNKSPTIACLADTLYVAGGPGCTRNINLPEVTITDGCSRIVSIAAYWTANGQPDTLIGTVSDQSLPDQIRYLGVLDTAVDFPTGVTQVLYVATDDCGNTGVCVTQVSVWDAAPPVAQCDTFTTVSMPLEGIVTVNAGFFNKNSTDSCGTLAFKVRRDAANTCQPRDQFYDFVQFCCEDIGDTLSITLRAYDVAVPGGPVAPGFAAGQSDDCTVRVWIKDIISPACSAPPDTVTTCGQFNPVLSNYGAPTLSCGVDSVAVSVDYTKFDSTCNQGLILRTFRAFDSAGNSGKCTQKITVQYEQDYWIKFPNDLIVTACNNDNKYNEPEFSGIDCEKLTVEYSDVLITVVPDACSKIERTWLIFNNCTYQPDQPFTLVPNPNPVPTTNHPSNLPGPVVSSPEASGPWKATRIKIAPTDADSTDFSIFWTANSNGYQYKQIIKIIDGNDPVIACPVDNSVEICDTTANDSLLWNAAHWVDSKGNHDFREAETDLSITAFDVCSGVNVQVRYLLFLDLNDDNLLETVVSSQYLPGFNQVNFDNLSSPPNYAGGTHRTFDERPVPANQKYGFALQKTVDGNVVTARLRWNTQEKPNDYVVPQLPAGKHRIKWFVLDGCGNEAECDYFFEIKQYGGACLAEPEISGLIKTEKEIPIDFVTVNLAAEEPGQSPFTDIDITDDLGAYAFAPPYGSSYALTPERNTDPLNGVTTFDLVLMSRHILGLDTLDTPYQLIAADINRSNSVTTLDIVELRKLILGVYTDFPNNKSWRFVDKKFVFPPVDPLLSDFNESITSDQLTAPVTDHDFVGIKTGDVNGSATANSLLPPPDDRSAGTLFLDLSDRKLRAGEVVELRFQAAEPVLGCQFTLHFPGLEVLDVLPEAGLSAENFAVFNEKSLLTASWDKAGNPAFRLRFRAVADGQLSRMLALSNRVARSEAYGSLAQKLDVALRFDGKSIQGAGFELYQNAPNPFSAGTVIGFYLPEASSATLTVFDATGRVLFRQSAEYPRGAHRIPVAGERLDASGVLFYQLETATDRAVRKMIKY